MKSRRVLSLKSWAYLNEVLSDEESSNGALDGGFWVTIGEGIPQINDGYGFLVQVGVHSTANQLQIRAHGSGTTYRAYHPVTLDAADVSTKIATGATVVLGGYVALGANRDSSNHL